MDVRWIRAMACVGMVLAGSAAGGAARPRAGVAAPLPPAWQKVPANERLDARKVAELDAMRALAERVYGFHIEGASTVYDYVLSSDTVRTRMTALLKGARETEKAEYKPDGTVEIVLGVKLRTVIETIEASLTDSSFRYKRETANEDRFIEALGMAAIPGSPGDRKVLGRRAAEVDAYRKMAGLVMGVHLESGTTVREFCTRDDTIRAAVAAFLRGLKPTDIVYPGDGTCEVTVQLKKQILFETVETIVRRRRGLLRTRTETEVNVGNRVEEQVFEVVGRGTWKDPQPEAPPTPAAAVDPAAATEMSRVLIQRVIDQGVVVE